MAERNPGSVGFVASRIAMVETGGDPGHGPARATCVAAGHTPMEVVRYFKRL